MISTGGEYRYKIPVVKQFYNICKDSLHSCVKPDGGTSSYQVSSIFWHIKCLISSGNDKNMYGNFQIKLNAPMCCMVAALYISLLSPDMSGQDLRKTYTLRECMEYAVGNSADMQVRKTQSDDERIARRDAVLQAFTPSVSADAYAYSNFGRTVDPETNTYISTTSFNNAYSVSAGITLFNGFNAVNNMKIARTAQSMGRSEEQQIIDRVCLATMEAYCNVVYYSNLAEILESQAETSAKTLELVMRQEELGQKGHADVVQAKADVADMDYRRIEAVNNMKNALITLKDIMFWPMDEDLHIEISSWENIRIHGEFSGDSETETAVNESLSREIEAITETALNCLPSIAVARGNMEAAFLKLRTARWQTAPSLNLYGGWSTSYYTYPGQKGYVPTPFWTQFGNNGGEYIQLTLSIPIFDRLSRHSEIARKKNEYRRAEIELHRKEREVEAEVRRAVQDRDGAWAAYLQADRRAMVQEEAHELNTRKLEQGLISQLEYRTSSEQYLSAMAERLNAALKYDIKRRVVEYYGGTGYLQQEY